MLVFGLLALAGRGGSAQPAPVSPAAVHPLSASTLAERVDRHYNGLRSLRVSFVQQYDGMGMHRRESGTLLLSRAGRVGPGRMRWTYAEPAGKLLVVDGRNAYFYTPGASEVQRVAAKRLDDLRSPLRFLLGHTQLGKELSNLTVSPGDVGSGGAQIFELSGSPRGMEQRVASVRLTVTADGAIRGIRIEETDGAVTAFTLSDEQRDVATSSADFEFKAPPGTNIVSGLPPI